ncbi:HD domain-containing protein [Anoxybacillus vitaminiphilus]|uniref:HD domain-containing protein n=1 Tax=Paranoxybacillus vitaminiphilus TaxID=581036 RepID=A0A327YBZ3_9BACL|nr:HD domain-containing phosphohydrolase [Anoxybacillus vitaminiphilus]RAK18493.1 HD domain-containing protein [Anoxybacillus vitaminiphilus]
MKDKNWYTWTIFNIGILSILYMIFHLHIDRWLEFLMIILFIFCLDFFTINLPSGDRYNGNIVGFLYVLFEFHWTAAVLAFSVSILVYNLTHFPFRQIKWFRFVVSVGMYSICGLATSLAIDMTKEMPLFVRIFLAICTFELTNQLILSGIFRTGMNFPFFHHFKANLQEFIVPILAGMIVLSKLLMTDSVQQLAHEVLYVSFFLVIIIFFSENYIQQVFLRQDMSREMVRLLESRIASRITGHGARVGAICEALVETFEYPKRRRPDLIQMAIIHDIGKSFLPSYMFEKRGALTLSEEREYKSHCEKGAEIIKTIYPKGPCADWVLYHHERWDGKGFPQGLKGENIPLESRILAVCNRLDHMMVCHQDDVTVYQLLQKQAGTVLDPGLVQKIDLSLISKIRATVGFEGAVPEEEERLKHNMNRNEGKQYKENSISDNPHYCSIQIISLTIRIYYCRKNKFHSWRGFQRKAGKSSMNLSNFRTKHMKFIFLHMVRKFLYSSMILHQCLSSKRKQCCKF